MHEYLLYLLGFGSDGLGSSLLEIVHRRLLALLHSGSHWQLLFTRFRRMVLLLGRKKGGGEERLRKGTLGGDNGTDSSDGAVISVPLFKLCQESYDSIMQVFCNGAPFSRAEF